MRSIPNCRPFPATTALAGFDPVILEFVNELRDKGGVAAARIRKYAHVARHFLVWLDFSGMELSTVDGTVIHSFLQHDCRCAASSVPIRLRRWRKCLSSPGLMSFIRFLERTGRIDNPGELDDNFRLLDEFLEGLCRDGFAKATINQYRRGCGGLLVWLHLSRIRLGDFSPEIHARFLGNQFVCPIPGVFCGQRSKRHGTAHETRLRGFLRHLVSIGRIERFEPAPVEKALPSRLCRFAEWLERQRGISPRSIRYQVRLIAGMLPDLGDDPDAYDAALIRRVLFDHMEPRSQACAGQLATATRMYLRFLASEGGVAARLVATVPTVPNRRLSALPRHIPAEDVERAIASCDAGPTGVRDRAILLLLARLALRAEDIVALRLDDICWDRAEIRLSGKSRRASLLPLPQDVGDALQLYVATARPRVDEERVFLRAIAPCRPLAGSGAVTGVARRALDRAGIKTFAGRGAHVFRHSQATALLRSGATLDAVQALLRHSSPSTTMIYAKTDAVMLQEIAQPWIGGIGQ